jgi:transcriptional regulator with XRE-family HTH domain
MGRASRPKPARLAEKLTNIRNTLGLSQNELIVRLGMTGQLIREEVSAFERGVREPPLPVILKYAKTAGVYVESIIDDDLELPDKLPSVAKYEGLKRKSSSRSRGRR